jgi:Ca2+-transporting ATPase
LIIFVGGHAFSVARLNGGQWAVCLILGLISLPVAVIIRLIPDEFIRKLVPTFHRRKKRPELVVSDEDRPRFEWNPALEEIRDQLSFFKQLRGGRLKNLAHKLQHPEEFLPRSRSGSRSRENSVPGTPVGGDSTDGSPPLPATPESRSRKRTRSRSNSIFSPAAAMAGVVAGSIAGWSPIERPAEGEPLKFDLNSSGGLNRQPGIEVHPDTAPDVNIVGDYQPTATTPPSQNPDLIPYFENAPPAREPSNRSRRSRSRSSQSQV